MDAPPSVIASTERKTALGFTPALSLHKISTIIPDQSFCAPVSLYDDIIESSDTKHSILCGIVMQIRLRSLFQFISMRCPAEASLCAPHHLRVCVLLSLNDQSRENRLHNESIMRSSL
jgi:hypothetical protein